MRAGHGQEQPGYLTDSGDFRAAIKGQARNRAIGEISGPGVEIVGVSTPGLLRKLALSTSQAESLLDIHEHLPRQLNAQASLTVSDVRNITDIHISLLDDLL